MRLNLGGKRAITLLPKNPAEGRILWGVAASLRLDYSVKRNGIFFHKFKFYPGPPEPGPETYEKLSERAHEQYWNITHRMLAGDANMGSYGYQGRALDGQLGGEISMLIIILGRPQTGEYVSAHAVNALRTGDKKFVFFGRGGIILESRLNGAEALIELGNKLPFRLRKPETQAFLDSDLNSIRIVESPFGLP